MKISVPCECSKDDLSREGFNNQMVRVTSSRDINQSLFLATPVIAQWNHEQSGHGGRDGGYVRPQQ